MNPVELIRSGRKLDDPEVQKAINWQDDPGWWRGRCAVAAVRAGSALNDPLVMEYVSVSDDPDYWRGRCAAAARKLLIAKKGGE